MKMYAVAFALDGMGDIYLDARLPLAAVTTEEIDRLLGAVLEYADGSFNTILELGFASSIRKEWEWRISRGEPIRNLEAFRGSAGARRAGHARGRVAGVTVSGVSAAASGRRLVGGPGARLAAGDGDTDQGEHAAGVRHRGRRLAEEDHAHHDRDRGHEVGRHAQAAGAHVLERERVGGERDRRREDAEVDQPPHATTRARRAAWRDQVARERQAADRADRAGQPGDVDRGEPPHQRLLEDQADRVGDGADQAEEHADDVAVARRSARSRTRSARRPRTPGPGPMPRCTVNRSSRNTAASNAISTGETWISIAAVPASTRRSPCVEGDVVEPEPEHPDHHDRDPARGRSGRGTPRDSATTPGTARRRAAAQRERAGGEVVAEVADGHERRGPEHQGAGDGGERQPGGGGLAVSPTEPRERAPTSEHAVFGRRTSRSAAERRRAVGPAQRSSL